MQVVAVSQRAKTYRSRYEDCWFKEKFTYKGKDTKGKGKGKGGKVSQQQQC